MTFSIETAAAVSLSLMPCFSPMLSPRALSAASKSGLFKARLMSSSSSSAIRLFQYVVAPSKSGFSWRMPTVCDVPKILARKSAQSLLPTFVSEWYRLPPSGGFPFPRNSTSRNRTFHWRSPMYSASIRSMSLNASPRRRVYRWILTFAVARSPDDPLVSSAATVSRWSQKSVTTGTSSIFSC